MHQTSQASPATQPRRLPSNVYYFRPYSYYYVMVFIFLGAFTCSGLSDYASQGSCILLWTAYITLTLLLITIDPLCVFEFKCRDEDGRDVILRRPVVGFKAYEVAIDLEAIAKREYTVEGGGDDDRLHDGYRYGYAFLRI
ncbi:hypothetical protein P170DRAFT_513456 [Aspergillus steynii IBT 23096]|uniref:Uncharacterized protein n=1 Tax=Aspergillus steynii IBT 23096 TaxID=1392250 RepID=A0A2I2FUB7_9EURO|nr:uncharacterized protein P170DRAFT_513456 [Aspergillus steynii IBT 23096]PLB44240.1 hypothetical protein P170DRAFT_513456 [Aspergillus steynii IBT 23096]